MYTNPISTIVFFFLAPTLMGLRGFSAIMYFQFISFFFFALELIVSFFLYFVVFFPQTTRHSSFKALFFSLHYPVSLPMSPFLKSPLKNILNEDGKINEFQHFPILLPFYDESLLVGILISKNKCQQQRLKNILTHSLTCLL